MREAVVAGLRQEGFVARGHGDAVNADGILGFAPDLAILDVGLPSGSGFALARRLRDRSPLSIIFLTARDAVADRAARSRAWGRRLRRQAIRARGAAVPGARGPAPYGSGGDGARGRRSRRRRGRRRATQTGGPVLDSPPPSCACCASSSPSRAGTVQEPICSRRSGATTPTTPTWSRCTSARCGASWRSAVRGSSTRCAASATGSRHEHRVARAPHGHCHARGAARPGPLATAIDVADRDG